MRPPRYFVVLLRAWIGILLLASTGVSSACSCSPLKPCGMHYADQDFIGQVISKSRVVTAAKRKDELWQDRFVYQIQVLESYASDINAGQIVEVMSGTGGADCSFFFTVGETYLVDAWQKDEGLWSSLCTYTAEIPLNGAFLVFICAPGWTSGLGRFFAYRSGANRTRPACYMAL